MMETGMALPHGTLHEVASRSFHGCWTCRLRRKKCDRKHPVCDTCAGLLITCYHDQDKPEWMDGGTKQEEVAERLKREVKEKAYLRRGERALNGVGDRSTNTIPVIQDVGMEHFPKASLISSEHAADCTLTSKQSRGNIGRSDTILLVFYLDHLFPFMFPFYQPSILQGGRAWILEMMISSPVVRQAILCQSSYFFSLAHGTAGHNVWEEVLKQTGDAFEVLRQSIQVIVDAGIREHLHGAVRILTSIMHMQSFEIAISSFDNCQPHLNAALALFEQLLRCSSADNPLGSHSSLSTVVDLLGPPCKILPAEGVQVPSAEQAALCFSSALLIFDDIIASTVLQEQPRLYDFHNSLLAGNNPPINFEAVVGCQNWVVLHVGEASMLDVWKQGCKAAGNLDMIELVRRATVIKDSLEVHLGQLENDTVIPLNERNSVLDIFAANSFQNSQAPTSQTDIVTRVWAHAALIYLSVIVSGWQPASDHVRQHVSQALKLLSHHISPPALLRTMVWPLCVAGCLAEPQQEPQFRGMLEVLQPSNIFGTAHKALEIMENVWRDRDTGDTARRDFASCFKGQSSQALILLV